jgi:hypothetical protein
MSIEAQDANRVDIQPSNPLFQDLVVRRDQSAARHVKEKEDQYRGHLLKLQLMIKENIARDRTSTFVKPTLLKFGET